MKWSQIKPGYVIEWEETLCRHRGTFRSHRITVAERRGKNIRTDDGNWLYWGERGLGGSSTNVISEPALTKITNV